MAQRAARSRSFMFTWNNYDGMPELEDFPPAVYFIYSEEMGVEGMPQEPLTRLKFIFRDISP